MLSGQNEEDLSTKNSDNANFSDNALATSNALSPEPVFVPPEMWQKVFSFLPSYSHLGLNRISRVCKYWAEIEGTPRIPFSTLLRDCLADDGKGAVYLLAHRSSIDKLTHTQLLTLCGSSVELCMQIIADLAEQDENICTQKDLIALSQHREQVAVAISISKLKDKCESPHLIGENHIVMIREYVKAYKENPSAIEKEELLSIVRNHLETTMEFLEDESFVAGLTKNQLVELCSEHKEAIFFVLRTPALLNRLGSKHLVKLASESEFGSDPDDIALEILQKFADKIKDNHILEVVQGNLKAAKYVLETPALLKRLSSFEIALIGFNHPSLIPQIYAMTEIKMTTFDLSYFGENYSIAIGVLNELKNEEIIQRWKDSLGQMLARLGRYHPDIAERILAEPKWRNSLDGKDLVCLCGLNKDRALSLVKDAELSNKLSNFNLLTLSVLHESVALYVYGTPELKEILTPEELRQIGQDHELIAKKMLLDAQVCAQLAYSTLASFEEKHPGVGKMLLETPHLKSRLFNDDDKEEDEEFTVSFLENRRKLAQLIQEKAYQFYKEHYKEDLYLEQEKAVAPPSMRLG